MEHTKLASILLLIAVCLTASAVFDDTNESELTLSSSASPASWSIPSIDLGGTVSASGSTATVSFKGGQTTFYYDGEISWGDGSKSTVSSQGLTSKSSSHTYSSDGTYSISIWFEASIAGSEYIGEGTAASKVIVDTAPAVTYHTVTYNANGGSGTTSVSVEKGSKISLPSSGFSKSYHDLSGWRLNSTSGTYYNAGSSYTVNSNVTFYAVWEPREYTISFNANGGSGSVSPITSGYGSSVKLPSSGFTRDGYIQTGWNTNSSGTGSDYSLGGTITISSNRTLYAVWEINDCTVTFNTNGGSNIASQTVEYNSWANVPSNPEKTGYVFTGWYDSSLNSKFDFSTRITADVTLYAKWTAVTGTYIENSNYKVNLETGKSYSETFTFASIPYSDFESIDSIVIELSDTSKGLSVRNSSEFVCTVSGTPVSSGTVYLRLVVNGMLQSGDYGAVMYFVTYIISSPTYSVTFSANGGSGTIPTQTVQPSVEITLPQDGFSKTGYILAGWNLNSVSGIFYDIGSKYTVTSDVAFYAYWVPEVSGDHGAPLECKTGEKYSFTPVMQSSAWILYLEVSGNSYYEIEYNGPEWLKQTGTKKQLQFEGTPLNTGVYLASICLTGPASGIENYSKQEWYITVTEDVPESYTVSFDSNNGTGLIPSQNVLPDNAVILPSEGIIRSGYTLTGWSEGPSGPIYNLGSLYTVTSDITFYAVWTADANLVVFDANGGIGNVTYTAATGDFVTLPSEGFTKEGCFLAGWSCSDVIYSPGYVYLVSGTVTMYAYWIPVDSSYVTVTYNANGGSSLISEQIVETGKTIVLPASGFNKSQSNLAGWNTSADASGVNYGLGDKVRITSNVTFYAQWEESSENVTVTFNLNGGLGSAASQTVKAGDKISKPSDPVRDGHIFTSWKVVGSTDWDFDSSVTESMTLIAQWQQHFTVTVNYLIVTVNVSAEYAGLIHTVDWGDGTKETKTGSNFSHTYESKSAGRVMLTTNVNDQKSVSSSLPYNLTEEEVYTVTFVYDDKISKVTVISGSVLDVPQDAVEYEWYLDKEFKERYELSSVTSDITLYGKNVTAAENDNLLIFILVTIIAAVLAVISAARFGLKGIPVVIIIAAGYACIILEVL